MAAPVRGVRVTRIVVGDDNVTSKSFTSTRPAPSASRTMSTVAVGSANIRHSRYRPATSASGAPFRGLSIGWTASASGVALSTPVAAMRNRVVGKVETAAHLLEQRIDAVGEAPRAAPADDRLVAGGRHLVRLRHRPVGKQPHPPAGRRRAVDHVKAVAGMDLLQAAGEILRSGQLGRAGARRGRNRGGRCLHASPPNSCHASRNQTMVSHGAVYGVLQLAESMKRWAWGRIRAKRSRT